MGLGVGMIEGKNMALREPLTSRQARAVAFTNTMLLLSSCQGEHHPYTSHALPFVLKINEQNFEAIHRATMDLLWGVGKWR